MVAGVEVAILGVLVSTDEHAIEGVVVLVGDLLLVVDVSNIGGVVENVLLSVGVGGVKVHEFEVLVTSVEVAVFGVLVSANEHTVKSIVMLVGNFLLVVDVGYVRGVIEDVLLQVSIRGVKVHQLEVLVAGVEVAVLGVFVSSDEHAVEGVVVLVGNLLLVVDVSDIGSIVKDVLLQVSVGGIKLLELLEVLVSSIEVSILSILVSSDKHSVESIIVLVGDFLLVVNVSHICGVIEDIFLQPGVGGVKIKQHFLFKKLIIAIQKQKIS